MLGKLSFHFYIASKMDRNARHLCHLCSCTYKLKKHLNEHLKKKHNTCIRPMANLISIPTDAQAVSSWSELKGFEESFVRLSLVDSPRPSTSDQSTQTDAFNFCVDYPKAEMVDKATQTE